MSKKISFKPASEVREINSFIDNWVNKPLHSPEEPKVLTPPDPVKEEEFKLTLTIPTYLHRRIKKTCAAEGVSIKDKLVEIFLDKFPEK
jgi:hypothetical protein